jgi:mono/diheme cytochrome c family protein
MKLQQSKTLGALALVTVAGMSSAQAEPVSFSKDVLPILQQNCVSCHVTGEELGNLGLAPSLAYAQLVGAKSAQSELLRVDTANPVNSYIVHKLNGTHLDQGGTGGRMPLGFPPLATEQIDLIKAWIAAGAPDN